MYNPYRWDAVTRSESNPEPEGMIYLIETETNLSLIADVLEAQAEVTAKVWSRLTVGRKT